MEDRSFWQAGSLRFRGLGLQVYKGLGPKVSGLGFRVGFRPSAV